MADHVGVQNVEFLLFVILDHAGVSYSGLLHRIKLLSTTPLDSAGVKGHSPRSFRIFCNLISILLLLLISSCTDIISVPEKFENSISIPDRYSMDSSRQTKSTRSDSGALAETNRDDASIYHSDSNHSGKLLPHREMAERWWESFGSGELNCLIDNAIGRNFTLRDAWARLKQAKALEDSQKSAIFPTITFDSSVSRRVRAHSADSYNTFTAGPEASYEVDLWGKINARVVEYEHKRAAASFDLETASISVAAEVAESWAELVTVREEISLVKQQVEINTMLLELLELRFQNSMSTALDVLQQREVVARSRARIPPLEIREMTLLNAIALLCGRSSQKEISVTTPQLRELPPMPETGIPAELLSNRPDIKSAALLLTASQWAIFQADAERLPSLNLTGTFLFQHTSLDSILKNWILTLASQFSGTLFDGGKNRAEVDLASGVMDERLVAYQKSVYTAIMEVENSIASEKYRTRWVDLLKTELFAAKLALEEARNRYIKGIDSFIPVVTEELNVQNLEIELLEQKALLFKDRISLCRAIGGRWR